MKIGIDPGISGAIALLSEANRNEDEIHDMPVMSNGKKQIVNAAEVAKILEGWRRKYEGNLTLYLERASARPGQGVTSMFSFGVSYGIIQGIAGALQIPMVLVTPSVWKKRAGLLGKEKNAARTLAQQLYPEAPLGRKKDIGRADALLIARFGERD